MEPYVRELGPDVVAVLKELVPVLCAWIETSAGDAPDAAAALLVQLCTHCPERCVRVVTTGQGGDIAA